jgi:hypothetical protein
VLRLYTIPEIREELGFSDIQVRWRIKKLNIPVLREGGRGRGMPRILVPLEPFTQPFPTRARKKAR